MTRRWVAVALVVALLGSAPGCVDSRDPVGGASRSDVSIVTTTMTAGLPPEPTVVPATSEAVPRPDWLGTRELETTADGYGMVEATPAELVDRRFTTVDVLAPPADDVFAVSVRPVDDAVLARSTWTSRCPVASDDLRYVTLPFWGFDGTAHTGELLVHADAVQAVTEGFAVLFADRFPIEEMRITTAPELTAPPTGDGNNTSAFVCRPARGATSWSQHAYGRSVDINPFHNPYVKGDVVLPELAGAYVDRANVRPGMLDAHAVRGFTDAGWGWGGAWRSSLDLMHVSATGT